VDVTSNGDDDLGIEHGPEDKIEAPSEVLSQIEKLE
jgi:hypothetical protein